MSDRTGAAKAPPRPKHVPQRTCVSCGSVSARRDLNRLVRTPSGEVEPDPTGKRAGRGAYLCHNADCWDLAIRKGRLESALRTKLSARDVDAILQFKAGHI